MNRNLIESLLLGDEQKRRLERLAASSALPIAATGDASKRTVDAPGMTAFSHLVTDSNLDVRPCDHIVDFQIGNLWTSTLS